MGGALPKAINIFLLPLYTRYLSPDEYGIISSMVVLSTIVLILLTLSIERSIYRLYFDYSSVEEKKLFLGTIFISLLGFTSFGITVILLFNKWFSLIYSTIPFKPFYLYMLFALYLNTFNIIPKIYYQVSQRPGPFVLLNFLEFIILSILIIYFIIGKEMQAEGYLLAGVIKAAAFLPIYILLIRKCIKLSFDKTILLSAFRYSIPLVPMMSSAWVLNLTNRIFLERYFTLSEVGVFSLATTITNVLLIFAAAFGSAFDPIFFKTANEQDNNKAKHKLYIYNNIYSYITIIVCSVVGLFSVEISLIFDHRYSQISILIPLLLIGFFFSQLASLLHRGFYQNKATKPLTYIVLTSAIFSIMANWLLIPTFGAIGAAYGMVISYVFMFVVEYYIARRYYFIPLDIKSFSIIISFSVLVFLISKYTIDNLPLVVFIKFAGVSFLVVYTGFIIKNKVAEFS